MYWSLWGRLGWLAVSEFFETFESLSDCCNESGSIGYLERLCAANMTPKTRVVIKDWLVFVEGTESVLSQLLWVSFARHSCLWYRSFRGVAWQTVGVVRLGLTVYESVSSVCYIEMKWVLLHASGPYPSERQAKEN